MYLIKILNCYYIVGLFYFSLGNVSPEYRSRLSSIYLVAIVKHKYISAYGIQAVLSPFLKDVAKLVSRLIYWRVCMLRI